MAISALSSSGVTMRSIFLSFVLATSLGATACASLQASDPVLDEAQLLTDLRILAADDMQGRQTGTPGNDRARAYIIERLEALGVAPVGDGYEHSFTFSRRNGAGEMTGVNILAQIPGTQGGEHTMVVTAHYDHEGVRGDQIWNGADDNASGVAGALAIAEAFTHTPPQHDVIIAIVDAEEMGLQGARAFVANPPIPLERVAFNLNLDMIAMSTDNILWAVGTYHYPDLVPVVEAVAARANVAMPMGFDEPTDVPGGDWTNLTDSGAFHAAGIPFIYLGVDFHPHYHQPTDTYENMTLDFFVEAARASVDFARTADESLETIATADPRQD
jgi:Zn-dependent M28 family amino/carboxypeptidase